MQVSCPTVSQYLRRRCKIHGVISRYLGDRDAVAYLEIRYLVPLLSEISGKMLNQQLVPNVMISLTREGYSFKVLPIQQPLRCTAAGFSTVGWTLLL